MRKLKQSATRNLMVFMASSTDHVTGKTSLTLTITASKDGGAFSAITPTVTERGSGWYNLALTTSHTDTLGDLALHVTGTGADATDLLCEVVAYNPGDAANLGLTSVGLIPTISTNVGTALTQIGLVKASTDNLPADPASETTLAIIDALIDAIKATIDAYLDAAVSTRAVKERSHVI